MSCKFAELFETEEYGQILVTKEYEDCPQISFRISRYNMNASVTVDFDNDDVGEAKRDEAFDNMTQEKAVLGAATAADMLDKTMEDTNERTRT